MTSEEAGYLGAMTYNNLYAPVLDTLRQQNRTDDRALAAVHVRIVFFYIYSTKNVFSNC